MNMKNFRKRSFRETENSDMTAAILHMQDHQIASFPRPKRVAKSVKAQLPNIAPRFLLFDDHETVDRRGSKTSTRVHVPRARLPPRSRFGCWTCRTRKVKCDEARPECTPCSRLGHICDYNPRLSFKDDTPRVVEKMSGGIGRGGPVWDSSARRLLKRQRPAMHDDLLPPFSGLTNDEDRERKAEYRRPGTYLVVVNSASFADFEDYKVTGDSRKSSPSLDAGSEHSGPYYDRTQYNNIYSSENDTQTSDDPDIVILRVFEDDSRKPPTPTSAIARRSSTPSSSLPSSAAHAARSEYFRFSYDTSPLMRLASKNARDHQIVYYYKNFVHRHLAQVHRDSLGTTLETGALSATDVLEKQAANFLPLYHALMAFSALSMSYKNGIANLDALQHYQKALPSLQSSLRSEQDLTSDGVFLTHFILLLYEIAAGEPRGLSLWSQHVDQLLRICLLRHKLYGHEPYSFIVWWVASIDTHVVLSGMGNGDFVETMLRNNMLPSGRDPQQPYETIRSNSPSRNLSPPRDSEPFPSALSFHRRLSVLAAEMGLLARDLRAEEAANPHDRSPATIQSRHERIGRLQDTLRRTWNVQKPLSVANGYCNQILPVNARGVFEHSFALYRALIIYSHTSMYSTQRLLSPSWLIPEVAQCASEILRLGREIVAHNHMERKTIVFPLFMAGFVSCDPHERMEILALVRKMEEDSVGRNVVAARQLLEVVYERQEGRREELRLEGVDGGEEDVDWVGMIQELGLQVVNCRL